MVKRIEEDQFNWPDDMSCIERTYEGISEDNLILVSEERDELSSDFHETRTESFSTFEFHSLRNKNPSL